jgi:hypothetical protein
MPDTSSALDLGAGRCTDGFFLLRDAEQRPFLPRDLAGSGWRFCATFRDSPTALRDTVLGLIRSARRKVFVTSFILGDDELIDALATTARRLTGGVYVISELSEKSLKAGLSELADRTELGQSVDQKVEAEKKRFMSLVRQGVAVRGHENCHAKFVVVDDEVAWVGSANLETKAFTLVGEAGVVFDDPRSVATLARLFARMWAVGCRYELPSFADGYQVTVRGCVPMSSVTVPEPVGPGTASIVWTDDRPHASLLHGIRDVVARAERDLVLATFSLNRMDEHPELVLDPVERAVDRGVLVRLFVRAMNDRDRHRRQAGLFHDLGVRVVADDRNHAKAAVADQSYGMLFSANLDAEHGLIPGTGIEVGARLDGTSAMPELVRYLDHAMECATREYVPTPTTRQLDDGLATRWQRPWPYGDDITVRCSPHVWQDLAAHAGHGPALWTNADGAVELLVGRLRVTLDATGPTAFELRRAAGAAGSAEQELVQWMRSRSGKVDRGFCTATLRKTTP